MSKKDSREFDGRASRRKSAVSSSRKKPELSTVTLAFLEHSTFLRKFLAGFLRVEQDIEDVAQEAYLRAYVAEQKEVIEQPKAFLFRVAKNLALTKLTKKSTQITDFLEDVGVSVVKESAAGIDEEVEAQQHFGLYCEAVAALPRKARQAFLLRKVHGLTHKEIADRMGLSISSVEKYLRTGLRACEAHIRANEGAVMTLGETSTPRQRGKVER